ncbi:hypothetical protein [Saccharopolyspora elongata]|uniref:Uncharacterized protein n=1 Tax=Saccharopolyspora elongata TaxID=2530387 RepID=A0A4R4YVM3_9PSEU|nr:hypothetical protein [Saccharopolyspora elongata]TDD47712.1 hypothetical protein E1288_23900 [Saccharopolyspora elongata]
MVRSRKKARRLVIDDVTFLWSVRHQHHVEQDRGQVCREVLAIGRAGAPGRVRIVFQGGAGRLVPDGLLHSGGVGTGGSWLNLHEPGTVRALLDEALAGGWDPTDPSTEQIDGWLLFDAVSALRNAPQSV